MSKDNPKRFRVPHGHMIHWFIQDDCVIDCTLVSDQQAATIALEHMGESGHFFTNFVNLEKRIDVDISFKSRDFEKLKKRAEKTED